MAATKVHAPVSGSHLTGPFSEMDVASKIDVEPPEDDPPPCPDVVPEPEPLVVPPLELESLPVVASGSGVAIYLSAAFGIGAFFANVFVPSEEKVGLLQLLILIFSILHHLH